MKPSITQSFLEAYPDTEKLLPIFSPEQLLDWAEEHKKFPFGFDSFPPAKKEYNAWHIDNLSVSDDEKEARQEEIAKKYSALFKQRIKALLNDTPKSQEEQLTDLISIRNEFFDYPVQIERDLLAMFDRKRITSWPTMSKASLEQELPLRDFFSEAIRNHPDAVLAFDEKKHLSPSFSGFVKQILITPNRPIFPPPPPIYEADGGYIQNGKIIWSTITYRHPHFWKILKNAVAPRKFHSNRNIP